MVQELVMETPSPQSVGLQFVQQYYTMLNKAPHYLHRFYSSNSSFLRGGLDSSGKMETAVQGQQAIHNKIMELNFRDCHTKIVMVDSQVTLGDGVVIQVSGELSNNGQPLRRFMQTFVLALQSPKQYYVQNDILRYQDEVFPDDDDNDLLEGSGEIEVEDEHVELSGTPNNVSEPAMSHYYGQHGLNNGSAYVDEPLVSPQQAPAPAAVVVVSTPQPVVGSTHLSETISSVQSLPVVTSSISMVSSTTIKSLSPSVSPDPVQVNSLANEKLKFGSNKSDDGYPEKTVSKSPELLNEIPLPTENEPKTYATMVSRKAGPVLPSPNISNPVVVPSPKPVPGIPTTQTPVRPELRSDNMSNSFMPPQPQRPTRMRSNNIRPPGPVITQNSYSSQNSDRINNIRSGSEDPVDLDRRRPIHQHPDENQIFVGNLPHDVTDDDLRGLFSQYGNVVDVRINNKATPKPNFGFIVFDDSHVVKTILDSKPVTYGTHRLNVEEKKKAGDRRNMINDTPRLGGPRLGNNPGRGGSMMGGRGGGMMGGRGGMTRGGMGGGMSRGGGMGGRGGYFANNNRR